MSRVARPKEGVANYEGNAGMTEQGLAWFFASVRWDVESSWSCVSQQGRIAKSMTARSPNDSAGEHNKGSGWTAAG